MKQAIICVGISGSGKSTFSKQFQKEHPSYIRINRDDLRAALFNMENYYNSPLFSERETLINIIIYNTIDSSSFKDDFIFDNTNLNLSHLKKLLGQLKLENIDFKFKLFDIDLFEAKKRVCCREDFTTFNEDLEEIYDLSKVKYIDKQFEEYKEIKKYILENYKDKILE